jgi:hypothetical protein
VTYLRKSACNGPEILFEQEACLTPFLYQTTNFPPSPPFSDSF